MANEENLAEARRNLVEADNQQVADEISGLKDKLGSLEKDIDGRISRVEEVQEDLGGTVEELETQLAQAETHETERIDKLESKLGQVQIDLQNESIHEKAAEKRVQELEKRVDQLESSTGLGDRLTELEEDVADLSRSLDDRIDEKIRERVDDKEGLDELEEEIADLESHVVNLTKLIKEEIRD